MTSASHSVSPGSSSSPSPAPSASAPSPAGFTSSAIFSADLDPRSLAIASLVGSLRNAERLAGELFAAQGRLAQTAIAAEATLGLSAVAGQPILKRLADAQSGTAAVRADLVSGHRLLERLAQHLDIQMSDFGDTGKPPQGLLDAPAVG